jgi:hypothetical protein
MIILIKPSCLFFDQVNIYAKFLCDSYANAVPSTDLSTDIVDKLAGGLPEARRKLAKDWSEASASAGHPDNFPALLVEPVALS